MAGYKLVARIASEIRRDIAAARNRDPAARGVSASEIVATWPGVHALLAHRVAHALGGLGVPLLPRAIAAIARSITGIEIHPAAAVGAGLFIDHGMGVVIGETAEIGDDVTLYQGVTLGGTGFATGKRHPTVQDNVTIGAGASLLGPITVGHGSKIGAGSVVIHDVPPNSTVVGNPGHPVRVEGRRPEGPDTDWVHLPDPIADAIKGLSARISALEETVASSGEGGRRCAGAAAAGSEIPRPSDGADDTASGQAARSGRTRRAGRPQKPIRRRSAGARRGSVGTAARPSSSGMFSRERTRYSGRPLTSS